MKATYRPRVRNGQITRRPVRSGHLGRAGWMPKSRRPQALWALMIIGAVIAGGFITSLRWQMRAQETGRRVVELKSALDQAESERKYLTVAESGSRNPLEIERAVNGSGQEGRPAPQHLDEPAVLAQARLRREAARRARAQMAASVRKQEERGENPIKQEKAEKPVQAVPASTQ